ncbi:MAG: ABC transporter permease, partial [Pseudomonadota bacterium]|nr:ABC transporter permease [Pseudomonadota bacterium]
MTKDTQPQHLLRSQAAPIPVEHPLIEIVRMFSANYAAVAGMGILLVIIMVSLAGPLFYPTDPFEMVWVPLSRPGVKGFLLG